MTQKRVILIKKSSKKKPFYKRKWFLVTALIIAIIAFLTVFTQAYLVFNVLIGKDAIIKLSADKENIFLKHGETENIEIKTYVTTNPFCKAQCSAEFFDLSDNKSIEKEEFEISPAIPKVKEFLLSADKIGKGQKIYRFDAECQSKKTFLCHTSDEAKSKSLLLTLNYDLNEDEEEFKNYSKNVILPSINELNKLDQDVDILSLNAISFENVIDEGISEKADNLKESIMLVNDTNYQLKSLWENQRYNELAYELEKNSSLIDGLKIKYDLLNNQLLEDVSVYNNLTEKLIILKQNLTSLKEINATNETAAEINNLIKDYNNLAIKFNQKNTLAEKNDLVINFSNNLDFTYAKIANETSQGYFADENANDINFSMIILNETAYSSLNISLKEPEEECCLFGKCGKCCDNGCYYDKEKFPVILLHGHDFSEAVSAEHSLNAFKKIQAKLENDGYLNAGALTLNADAEGVWGRTNYPAAIIASYYFDIYKNTGEPRIIETKTDNIDTYAIRLRDIIDVVKYKTNKDKVMLVSHSMGGLVIRRYMQLFGSEDINKIIMVAAPNKGIDDKSTSYCSLFGANLECKDMNENSLFIDKISAKDKPNVAIYNLIGIGCKMDDETGDGIVKKSSASLDYAENYYIEGSCNELKFDYLHSEILDIEKYPRVYEIIKEKLKE